MGVGLGGQSSNQKHFIRLDFEKRRIDIKNLNSAS